MEKEKHIASNVSEVKRITTGEDLYRDLAQQEHFNWILRGNNKPQSVLSIEKKGKPNQRSSIHRAVLTNEKGTTQLFFEVPIQKETDVFWDARGALVEQIKNEGYQIDVTIFDNNTDFRDSFIEFEAKHPQAIRTIKMGILYVRDSQDSPQDQWFNNGHDGDVLDPKFWSFINFMGSKKDMSTWRGYRGEMSTKTGLYEYWQGVEVVCHLAPELSKEEIRRLIGNDIVIVIYVESGAFPIKALYELGNVPQIYIIVHPEGDLFRTEFYQKSCITEIGPAYEGKVDLATLKQIILTRAFNGLHRTRFCPPMNRLFSIPRKNTLQEILTPFLEGGCA